MSEAAYPEGTPREVVVETPIAPLLNIPPIREFINMHQPTKERFATGMVFHPEALDVLNQDISNYKLKLKEEYPDLQEGELNALFDLAYGFFQLKSETIFGEEKVSDEQKYLSARIQHNLASQVLYALQTDNDLYVDAIYQVIAGMHKQVDRFG